MSDTGSILNFMYPHAAIDDYSVTNGVITYWDSEKLGQQPTYDEIAQQELPWRNATTWAAQAAARKEREAKAALALPDSDDPVILRRKLNAALYLIQR